VERGGGGGRKGGGGGGGGGSTKLIVGEPWMSRTHKHSSQRTNNISLHATGNQAKHPPGELLCS